MRLTKRGQYIYTFFKSHPSLHPTAEEVYMELKTQDISIGVATVYRNLKTLVDLGILREISIEKQGVRYDLHDKPHDHFLCDACGKIDNFNIPSQNIIKEIEKTTHGKVTSTDVIVHGVCAQCLNKSK